MKKITITAKPAPKPKSTADDWVQQRTAVEEKIKRLTIDLPASLHTRVKSQCVLRGTTMVELVRDFLEREFPEVYRSDDRLAKPTTPGRARPERDT